VPIKAFLLVMVRVKTNSTVKNSTQILKALGIPNKKKKNLYPEMSKNRHKEKLTLD
jgi:hypothetical protein